MQKPKFGQEGRRIDNELVKACHEVMYLSRQLSVLWARAASIKNFQACMRD
jgi:hypothetical protein